MAEKDDSKGVKTEIVVAIIGLLSVLGVALIENWRTIFPEKELTPGDSTSTISPSSTPLPTPTPPSTPTPLPTPTPPSTPTPDSVATSTPPATGCILTIRNPLVPLMSQPDRFSQELVRLQPDDYTSLDYTTTNFGGIREESWFLVEADGRRGWIQNDTWAIDRKSSACP